MRDEDRHPGAVLRDRGALPHLHAGAVPRDLRVRARGCGSPSFRSTRQAVSGVANDSTVSTAWPWPVAAERGSVERRHLEVGFVRALRIEAGHPRRRVVQELPVDAPVDHREVLEDVGLLGQRDPPAIARRPVEIDRHDAVVRRLEIGAHPQFVLDESRVEAGVGAGDHRKRRGAALRAGRARRRRWTSSRAARGTPASGRRPKPPPSRTIGGRSRCRRSRDRRQPRRARRAGGCARRSAASAGCSRSRCRRRSGRRCCRGRPGRSRARSWPEARSRMRGVTLVLAAVADGVHQEAALAVHRQQLDPGGVGPG